MLSVFSTLGLKQGVSKFVFCETPFFVEMLQTGVWKQKWWKQLNFCGSGSTLKKEAESGSKFGSI